MGDRARLIVGILLGAVLMAVGVRLRDVGQAGPPFSYEIVRFVGIPEGAWWVNPYLLVIGAAIIVTALLRYTARPRRRLSVLVLTVALAILLFRPSYLQPYL